MITTRAIRPPSGRSSSGSRFRECQPEVAASSFRFGVDAPALALDRAPCDRKTKAAALLAACARAASSERLEDRAELVGGDARAVVSHVHDHLTRFLLHDDGHVALIRVLDGVEHDVLD